MKIILLSFLMFSNIAFAQNYGGGNSCSVGERRAWCRDMNTNPSSDKQVEINGCSVSCSDKYKPICNPGYLTGRHCDEPVEPSYCYCG